MPYNQNPTNFPYYPQPQTPYYPPRPRLKGYDTQFRPIYEYDEPQYQQPQQMNPPQSQEQQSTPTVTVVTSEQQARDWQIDQSGAVQIFALQDESRIFCKRLDLSTFLPEFSVYEKVSTGNVKESAETTVKSVDGDTLKSINQKLDKISKFVDDIPSILFSGNAEKVIEEQPRTNRRSAKKDEADEGE